MLNVDIVA